DEAAATEALQAIAIAKELADAFDAFGKHGDERLLPEQALRVLFASAGGAEAIGRRPEERKVVDDVFGEPPHVARRRMLALPGGADHQAVERNGPRVVRDDE